MNERFEQMMLEATKDMPQGYYVPGEYFQKFAELIVRECLSIVQAQKESLADDESDWSFRDFGYEAAVNDAVDMINQHFGVEE